MSTFRRITDYYIFFITNTFFYFTIKAEKEVKINRRNVGNKQNDIEITFLFGIEQSYQNNLKIIKDRQ